MVQYRRKLDVRHHADVLVAGGGPAGVAAAMSVPVGANTRGIDVRELQARLKSLGAYLPNFTN